MDYKSLLSLAERKQEMNDTINGFNTRRKSANGSYTSGPDRAVIEAFKARKLKEEMEKRVKAHKEKERLLSLRAQNSKSMKKARMMKTRTKDNDFSRIVLTAEQIEEQRRVEEKLKRKGITDLCERMKTRIDLEEEEAVIQKKKPRNKSNNTINNNKNNSFNPIIDKKIKPKITEKKNSENKERSRLQKPAMSYEQILNLAQQKSNTEKTSLNSLSDELISEFQNRKQVRPMTQKEKDALIEEQYYKQRANKGLARLPTVDDIRKNAKSQENRRDINKNHKNASINKTNNNNINNNINNSNRPSSKSVINSNSIESTSNEAKQMKSEVPKNSDYTNRMRNNVSNSRSEKSFDERQRVPQIRPQYNQKPTPGSSSQSNKLAIIKKMDNRMESRRQEIYSSDKYSPQSDKYSPHSDKYSPHSDKYNPHSEKYNPHSDKYSPHSDKYNPHSEKYNPHSDKYSPHSEKYNPHSDKYSPHSEKYNPHSDKYSPHSDKYSSHSDNPRQSQRPRDPKANNEYRLQNKNINDRARAPSPRRRAASPPPPRGRSSAPSLPPIGSTYRRAMYEDVAQYVDDDYEEEEDDDMSDFIDDGPEEKPVEEDYSRAIREIFGYDKRKYRNIDDDDDIEEANFAQCMKEESHSLRVGIQEDLEDIRLEEEEKKRKMLERKRQRR